MWQKTRWNPRRFKKQRTKITIISTPAKVPMMFATTSFVIS